MTWDQSNSQKSEESKGTSRADNVNAELYKRRIQVATFTLHSLIYDIWKQEKIPEECKCGVIIKLLPKKGDTTECGN